MIVFRSFESELRSYSGSDPLSVWHEYIVWVEQAAGRREGNLKTLLEKCIKELKDDARYTQDARFMDVWAKGPFSYDVWKRCLFLYPPTHPLTTSAFEVSPSPLFRRNM